MDEAKHNFGMIFDSRNPNWSKNSEVNALFLRAAQQFVNQKLMVAGFVFLNEVYEVLGYPRTAQGQIQGWFWEQGSQIIDFDYAESGDEEGSITIRVVTDGEIWQRLP